MSLAGQRLSAEGENLPAGRLRNCGRSTSSQTTWWAWLGQLNHTPGLRAEALPKSVVKLHARLIFRVLFFRCVRRIRLSRLFQQLPGFIFSPLDCSVILRHSTSSAAVQVFSLSTFSLGLLASSSVSTLSAFFWHSTCSVLGSSHPQPLTHRQYRHHSPFDKLQCRVTTSPWTQHRQTSSTIPWQRHTENTQTTKEPDLKYHTPSTASTAYPQVFTPVSGSRNLSSVANHLFSL